MNIVWESMCTLKYILCTYVCIYIYIYTVSGQLLSPLQDFPVHDGVSEENSRTHTIFHGWLVIMFQLIIVYTVYTLWLFNIAMENGPFTDDFPIKTSIYEGFSMAMLNNQMVNIH